MTEESRDGPTPNGGVKSTAYYLDDDGNPAEKAVATQVRIVEYNAAGEPIFRTYGKLNRPATEEAHPTALAPKKMVKETVIHRAPDGTVIGATTTSREE